jgi:hypothetical protein
VILWTVAMFCIGMGAGGALTLLAVTLLTPSRDEPKPAPVYSFPRSVPPRDLPAVRLRPLRSPAARLFDWQDEGVKRG